MWTPQILSSSELAAGFTSRELRPPRTGGVGLLLEAEAFFVLVHCFMEHEFTYHGSFKEPTRPVKNHAPGGL